jgi:hypothetical protein
MERIKMDNAEIQSVFCEANQAGWMARQELKNSLPQIDFPNEAFTSTTSKSEELQKQQEVGLYRFYYCESEDSYLLGMRVGNFYYAHWDGHSFTWDMSKNLPWGQHIVSPTTAWKEHTYPSEPVEISADEWISGFLRKVFEQKRKR